MLDNNAGYIALGTKELDQRLERWADWARCPIVGAVSTEVGYMKERLEWGPLSCFRLALKQEITRSESNQ